jgi:hypothetical protein
MSPYWKHVRRLAALALLAAGCTDNPTAIQSRTANDPVTVAFTGTVRSLRTGDGGAAPMGVAIGDPVSGTLSYAPGVGRRADIDASNRVHSFTDDGEQRITVRIGAMSWNVPLKSVAVCNDAPDGDRLACSGTTASASEFPEFRGQGLVHLSYSDGAPPYDLVTGLDLPAAAHDVRFDMASFKGGVVATGSTMEDWWEIYFELDASTLP